MKKKKSSKSNTMWGGRFEDKPADIMEQINASIGVDQRLWRQDIKGSIAHCQMLAKQKILSKKDSEAIILGLEQVAQEMAEGALARSDANLALSVTGIAGPGGSDHKPEGRVCFGLVQDGCDAFTETVEFGAIGRAQVRTATVVVAMEMLLGAVDT